MSALTNISRGETTIDFVGLRRRWFMFSAVLILVSLAALGLRQLNFGLEFEGGVAIQSPNPAGAGVEDLRETITSLGLGDARIQLIDDGEAVLVQTGPLDQAAEDELIDVITSLTGVERVDTSLDAVGPTFGTLVARQALIALGVFLALAVLFIAWRLQWKMGLVGIVALFHDMIITIGVYALLQFPVTPATVVALLTILGYSLYDTVVVFDRVEEYTDEMRDDHTYTEIVNRAMNKVLIRSLLTSLTSLIPVGSLLFVGSILLGASSLQDFALALFVGMAAGTYSSIMIAGPLLAVWREGEDEWTAQRHEVHRIRDLRAAKTAEPATAAPPQAPKRTPERTEASPDRPPGSGPAPRPPKKGRR
ncbi:MAG: protein translocase subunit SecF [Acidimicrobiia bacterium]